MHALRDTIATIPLFDTHEHLITPSAYADLRPDIITALFGMHSYLMYDFVSAGCSHAVIDAFLDQHNHDIAARWNLIAPYWDACQYTGAGEAVRLAAQALYDIDHIDGLALQRAVPRHQQYLGVDGYHAILQRVGISQIQVDAFTWEPPASAEVPALRFDLNIESIASGTVSLATLAAHLGLRIDSVDTYRQAIEALIAQYAERCVALKTQHAYARTLAWLPVPDAAIAPVLETAVLGLPLTSHQQQQLGDWGLGVAAEAAARHGLPIKIHTGHHAGNNTMPLEWLSPRLLTPLFRAFPDTRFVLMHIGYPYHDELLSLAKQYRSVYTDLCWAWCIDPHATSAFVRSWIHTVPITKLFGFGGDAFLPAQALGYALQARVWLTRTLCAEVTEGALSEAQAIAIARALCTDNQQAFFTRSTQS